MTKNTVATKKIVLLDIDGTLLDSSYRVNCNSLPALIQEMQQCGYMFALNSNRSLEDIVPVAEQFAIMGPLIAENGVFFASLKDRSPKPLVPKKVAAHMSTVKVLFENRLKHLLATNYKDQWVWCDTDTVELLSKNDTERTVYPKGTIVFASNHFRRYTVSIHVMISDGKNLKHASHELVDELCDGISKWAADNDFLVTRGYEFSNILAYSNDASKRQALVFVAKHYKGARIIGIGNEVGDAEMMKDIGTFYAVNNAMELAKKSAVYVSEEPITKGVKDILEHIRKATDV
jgi:hydroxymethylpyrimidine pyrophosphatase-like HAD family hydrolase